MLRDSRNPLVKNTQLSIITGQKWKAKIAVENAELALKMKEIIGTVANGKTGQALVIQGINHKQKKNGFGRNLSS